MKLTDKAKSICQQHYISFKTPGCDKCPIQQECYGRKFSNTSGGIELWITEINKAAERVGLSG